MEQQPSVEAFETTNWKRYIRSSVKLINRKIEPLLMILSDETRRRLPHTRSHAQWLHVTIPCPIFRLHRTGLHWTQKEFSSLTRTSSRTFLIDKTQYRRSYRLPRTRACPNLCKEMGLSLYHCGQQTLPKTVWVMADSLYCEQKLLASSSLFCRGCRRSNC